MDAVTTVASRIKLAKARAGLITMPKIAGIALGSGGVNSQGSIITPIATQTALNNEVLRREYDSCTMVTDTSYRYKLTLGETELTDVILNEIALYDSDGDLVAIKNFSSKKKDSDIEMSFSLDDIL